MRFFGGLWRGRGQSGGKYKEIEGVMWLKGREIGGAGGVCVRKSRERGGYE